MRSVARRVLVPGRSSVGDQMRGEMWRRLAALAVAIAPGVVAVPLVASWRGRLPASLATHWKIGAAPDEFTGRDGFLSLVRVGVAGELAGPEQGSHFVLEDADGEHLFVGVETDVRRG